MTPASISQWLQQPHKDIEPHTLQGLLERYPYFIPLRYIAVALEQKGGQPVSITGYAHLYQGNRVLLYQMMQQLSKIKEEPVQEEEIQENYEESIAQTNDMLSSMTENSEVQQKEEPLIQPVFSADYFLHQGIQTDDKIPLETNAAQRKEENVTEEKAPEDPKSLMVVMSFTEWLMFFKSKTQKEKEDEEDRKAVKHMWQKEKLAAALEEEDEEIPENVFEMAVNSISKEDGLASESLAEVLAKQGKWEKAIEMYRKLSLRNPQKSAYFAQQIATIQKQFQ